jgi:ribosomal protein S18 acetylase RimI-like enzyme
MIRYRNATAHDISQIMDIKFRSTQHLAEPGWGWDPVVELAYYSKHFRPETYSIIIYQDHVAGYFSIYQTGGKLLYLETMVIDISFQRKGIGTKVLSELVKMAHLELNQLELSVQKNNLSAKSFYERQGFEIFSHSLTHYRMKYDPYKNEN